MRIIRYVWGLVWPGLASLATIYIGSQVTGLFSGPTGKWDMRSKILAFLLAGAVIVIKKQREKMADPTKTSIKPMPDLSLEEAIVRIKERNVSLQSEQDTIDYVQNLAYNENIKLWGSDPFRHGLPLPRPDQSKLPVLMSVNFIQRAKLVKQKDGSFNLEDKTFLPPGSIGFPRYYAFIKTSAHQVDNVCPRRKSVILSLLFP